MALEDMKVISQFFWFQYLSGKNGRHEFNLQDNYKPLKPNLTH